MTTACMTTACMTTACMTTACMTTTRMTTIVIGAEIGLGHGFAAQIPSQLDVSEAAGDSSRRRSIGVVGTGDRTAFKRFQGGGKNQALVDGDAGPAQQSVALIGRGPAVVHQAIEQIHPARLVRGLVVEGGFVEETFQAEARKKRGSDVEVETEMIHKGAVAPGDGEGLGDVAGPGRGGQHVGQACSRQTEETEAQAVHRSGSHEADLKFA